MRSCTVFRLFFVSLLTTSALSLATSIEEPRTPDIKVALLADRSAISPGRSVELAIRFEIEPGWHIYWLNRGEGGLEPRFQWTLPDGFQVGSLRFPPPRRHIDQAGTHTFVLEGKPVILATLTAPPEVPPGRAIKIKLDARWLACKGTCYLGQSTPSFTLPVVEPTKQVLRTHETLFRKARAALPLPMTQAQYLKRLSASADISTVRPGDKFVVAVCLEKTSDYAIGADESGVKKLAATDLFPYKLEGLLFGRPVFGEGRDELESAAGPSRPADRDKVKIQLPVEVDASLEGDEVRIGGVVTYQAYSTKEQKPLAATSAEWSLTLPLTKPEEARADEQVPPRPSTRVVINKSPLMGLGRTDLSPEGIKRPSFGLLPIAGKQGTTKAKYLKSLSAVANVDKVKPGASFELAVQFEVQPDYHVNSHKPLSEFLIPTRLSVEQIAGVTMSTPVFPEGKREAGLLPDEPLSIYLGKNTVFVPVRIDASFTGDDIRFGGTLSYQACSDKTKQCYPPTSARWSLVLPVAKPGETVSATNEPLFARSPLRTGLHQIQPDVGTDEEGHLSVTQEGFSLDSDIYVTTAQEHHSLLVWLGLALLAGMILNVTPCVLPVISIKVLSFVQQANESPAKVFKLGLAFSFGMLFVFNILAMMATALGLVWGQHFQSPTFTIVMAAVIFAFGLSLFGVFTLGVPRSVGDLAVRAEGEGYIGSIAKGALATIMGTPCLGPFLGSVLVWAASQPAPMVFLIFNTIGLGMALPYLMLTAHPAWMRFIPKPGPWMETFKEAMGFLLMGTVAYLLNILQGQLGGMGLVWTLIFLIGVALACWVLGRWLTPNTSTGGRVAVFAVALLILVASAWVSYGKGMDWEAAHPKTASTQHGELRWEDFSLDRLKALTAAGKTVLLDITAEWCPNCKTNTLLVFDSQEVAQAVSKYKAVPMLADWTAQDDTIGQLINKLAPGASIPLCAVFPANQWDEPIVMLGLVTKQQVIDALREAAGA